MNEETQQRTDSEDEFLNSILEEVAASTDAPAPKPVKKTAPVNDFWTLPGFVGKARVSTAFGELPIEALRRRDGLRTSTGEFLMVEWVDQVHLDEDFLARHPAARPILIRPDSLGRGIPGREFAVSPRQQVQYFDIKQKTEMAAELLGRPGIVKSAHEFVTYYLFHCGRPALVKVEGLWCQTAPMNAWAL